VSFVSNAHGRGVVAALVRFGLKNAAEELRLKIPSRTFHGFDAAHKTEADRGAKKAADEIEGNANNLADMFKQLEEGVSPAVQLASRDPLDRQVSWGAPSNLAAGDAGNRVSDMGQPTGFGGV